MATYYAKRGDVGSYTPTTILRDGDGVAVNLTGAAVAFIMTAFGAVTPTVAAAGEVVAPATSGEVRYEWAANDLDAAGLYRAEWQVTYDDAAVETFPVDGYIIVWVREDLGDIPT